MAPELNAAASSARAARRRWREIAAGAAALGALIATVAWVSVRGSAAAAGGHYLLEARFTQVDGLVVGGPVHLAGLRIGSVAALSLDGDGLKPRVVLAIRNGVKIPVDSAALIMSDGVLGGKFVRIDAGAEDKMMAPGQNFGSRVQDSVIVERLLERIVRTAEARREGK